MVKVNPDPPQRAVRFRALRDGKVLLMPPPGLRAGFLLLRIEPRRLAPNQLYAASSIKGAFAVGEAVGLDDLPAIDLLVVGSVAVSASGERVGKGEGYAELEFAVLRTLGVVPDDIPIATTVHDAQVVPAIPREPFDVTLDLICTRPTRCVRRTAGRVHRVCSGTRCRANGWPPCRSWASSAPGCDDLGIGGLMGGRHSCALPLGMLLLDQNLTLGIEYQQVAAARWQQPHELLDS